MPTHQDKAAADVLDYHVPHQAETKREWWLFGLAIGLNLIFGICWFFMSFNYYEAYRLFTGMKPLAYKIGAGMSFVLPPVAIGLAIIGLYLRNRFGYWLAGCWAGFNLLLVLAYIYILVFDTGSSFLVMTDVLVLELFFPLIIGMYFSYFLTRNLVRIRCRASWLTFTSSLSTGLILGIVLVAFSWWVNG